MDFAISCIVYEPTSEATTQFLSVLCIKQFTGLFPFRITACVSFRRTSCESSTFLPRLGQRISSARFALQANLRTSSSGVFVLIEGLRKKHRFITVLFLNVLVVQKSCRFIINTHIYCSSTSFVSISKNIFVKSVCIFLYQSLYNF